ncbi:hypothetical protein EDF62_3282 [Leucobacter luti]|uniref:Uncharacterized protein n=1 Tax=Leucobacter luti TaxID=340320 RepID=A0A4R6RRT2_9MICO|nr:hypothetical protein [Leucobacter luti]TDP89551.1 hypothetical protein EDF62_3282 [Leucobacter luti]
MKRIIYRTQDRHALAWWAAYLERYAAAVDKLDDFGADVTPLIGPCAHGGNRHDIAYVTAHRDEVCIVGVNADAHDLVDLPAGMLLVEGVLRGDPGTSIGLRFIDLAEQHSTLRLMEGVDVIGIPSRVPVDGGVHMPGIAFDPVAGTLYQFWTKRGDVKRSVKTAIARSGITWEKTTDDELEFVKARANEMRTS